MKTIALIGSPRKEGNCDQLVSKLLDNIEGYTKKFYLNDVDLQFCNACQSCQKGDCIKDDDGRKIIDEMLDSDIIVFASPIYYGQMSAQAKTILDRFYMISQNPDKSLEGKKVIQVFTQANPGDAFDAYIKSFAYMGMEVIDTIIAKGAAGKGEGIEDALKKIEELEI